MHPALGVWRLPGYVLQDRARLYLSGAVHGFTNHLIDSDPRGQGFKAGKFRG